MIFDVAEERNGRGVCHRFFLPVIVRVSGILVEDQYDGRATRDDDYSRWKHPTVISSRWDLK